MVLINRRPVMNTWKMKGIVVTVKIYKYMLIFSPKGFSEQFTTSKELYNIYIVMHKS